jgi:hypothetical protein
MTASQQRAIAQDMHDNPQDWRPKPTCMTTPDAKLEAIRRWGSAGFAYCPDGLFTVGCGSIEAGWGESWEEAFAAADKDLWIAGYMHTVQMLEEAVTK